MNGECAPVGVLAGNAKQASMPCTALPQPRRELDSIQQRRGQNLYIQAPGSARASGEFNFGVVVFCVRFI